MKPIKIKDLKVGDWVIIKENIFKETNRNFIIRIEKFNKRSIEIIWYRYGNLNLNKKAFCNMTNKDWKYYNLFKTTKIEYKKLCESENILKELEK